MDSRKKYEENQETVFTLETREDEIIRRVQRKLEVRSVVGQFDYGTTLFDNKNDKYLLQLQSELLDAANYVEAYVEHREHQLKTELVKFGNYLLSEQRNSDKKWVTDADLENYKLNKKIKENE